MGLAVGKLATCGSVWLQPALTKRVHVVVLGWGGYKVPSARSLAGWFCCVMWFAANSYISTFPRVFESVRL